MGDNALLTLFLPIALAIVMTGLGLHLILADFRRVAAQPRAVLIALIVQTLLLPPVAFGLAALLRLPPEFAVGLVLLAASPGGVTSIIFSHLARGDVALNVTLTAVNSLLALVTLPLWTGLALQFFLDSESAVPPPLRKAIEVAVIAIVPVALGMTLKAWLPKFAAAARRPVQWLARPQAIAIGFEISIHNSTLAILLALQVLGSELIAIPPAVYAVLMYPVATAFAFWLLRKRKAETAVPVSA
jgi:BASS family bile acid:Na+ symporter